MPVNNQEIKKLKEYEQFLENFDIFNFTKKKKYQSGSKLVCQQYNYDRRNEIFLEFYNDHEILDLIPDLKNPLLNTKIDPVNRTKMIDWFVRIQLSLQIERFYDVVFRAICLFDCCVKFSKNLLVDEHLYAFGSTILYVANKYELIHPFSIDDYCQNILNNDLNPKLIAQIEFEVIKSLNFKFVYTTYYELVCVLLTKFFNHNQSQKFEEFQQLTGLVTLMCMYDLKFNNFDQMSFAIACILVSMEIFFTDFNKKKAKKYNKKQICQSQQKFINSILKNFQKEQITYIKAVIAKIRKQVEKVYQKNRSQYMCGPLLDKLLQKMFK